MTTRDDGRGVPPARVRAGAAVAVAALLAMLGTGCSSGPEPAPPTNDPEFAARLAELSAAYQSRDADRILSFYAPDTHTLSFGQNVKYDTGSQSHKASLQKLLGRVQEGKLSLGDDTQVWKRDQDRVWTLRSIDLEAKLDDGSTLGYQGKHSAIWEKQGGVWLIAYEHFWGDPKLTRPGAPPPAAPPMPPPGPPPLASIEEAQGYLKDIFFDLDKSNIRPDQRATMDANVDFLKKYPSVEFTIEGHCDDRASRSYNMKLGQRRADETKDFLMAAGIDPARMKTVTMGKERPFVAGKKDEDSRQQNRRSHFVVTKK